MPTPVAESSLMVGSSQPSPKKSKLDSLPGGPIKLQIAKLSENATIPTRGSARAAGYDLYSAEVSSLVIILLFSRPSSSDCFPSVRTLKFQPEARDW